MLRFDNELIFSFIIHHFPALVKEDADACEDANRKKAGTPPFVLTICFDYDSVTVVFLIMEAFEP